MNRIALMAVAATAYKAATANALERQQAGSSEEEEATVARSFILPGGDGLGVLSTWRLQRGQTMWHNTKKNRNEEQKRKWEKERKNKCHFSCILCLAGQKLYYNNVDKLWFPWSSSPPFPAIPNAAPYSSILLTTCSIQVATAETAVA